MHDQSQQTILLVEDEAIIAMDIARKIEGFGYEVMTVHSGEDAVKIAADTDTISLILMDINLGGSIDGTEAAKQILAVRHIPIVFLSSQMEEEYVARVKEITRYGYVAKNSGNFVLKSSIEMAFELFKEHQKIRQNEKKYRTLVETIQEGLWQINKDSYTTYVNPKMAEILGYTPGEMLGKHLFDFMDERGIAVAKQELERRQKGISEQHDFEFIRNDGHRIYALLETAPIFDDDGHYEGALAAVMDITERKKAEEALQKSQRELQEANETKDRFFSIVAHDLLNILIAFEAGTDMLTVHLQDSTDEFAQQIAGELYKRAKKLSELLKNLLEWSRLERGKLPYRPGSTNLHYAANYIVELSRANAEQKDIDLVCSIDEATFVYADYDMLQTVFRNLISNAIKYTENGGEIRIEARDNGDFVEIAVKDKGVGIPEQQMEPLFHFGEKRRSTAGTAGEEGTGLGLILCREFIEKHGGQIWAESEEGLGSTFKFTLPAPKPVSG